MPLDGTVIYSALDQRLFLPTSTTSYPLARARDDAPAYSRQLHIFGINGPPVA